MFDAKNIEVTENADSKSCSVETLDVLVKDCCPSDSVVSIPPCAVEDTHSITVGAVAESAFFVVSNAIVRFSHLVFSVGRRVCRAVKKAFSAFKKQFPVRSSFCCRMLPLRL